MRPKVLLVEDNATTRELLSTILSLEGFEVVSQAYPDGVQAVINSLREENPQLVLMDFHIGQFNGIDLVSTIRQDELLHHLPILMSSGADVKESCLKAGADAFIMKPYGIDQLVQAIKEILPTETNPR
jgi:CheY-like chemotaxis protein